MVATIPTSGNLVFSPLAISCVAGLQAQEEAGKKEQQATKQQAKAAKDADIAAAMMRKAEARQAAACRAKGCTKSFGPSTQWVQCPTCKCMFFHSHKSELQGHACDGAD